MAQKADFGIKTNVDDAALKSLLGQLGKLPGMAATIKVALDSAFKAASTAAATTAKATQEWTQKEVQGKQQASDKIKGILGSEIQAAKLKDAEIEAATKRRVEGEEKTERLKYEHLKQGYKDLIKETDILNAALKASKDKEVKAEIKAELDKANELKKIYQTELKERPETKKGHSSDVGMLGTKRETEPTGMGMAKEALSIGAAVEGFKLLKEHAEEATAAEKGLSVGTGQTGEELEKTGKAAEEIGNKFAVSGESAKIAMGKVASYTGATGEELNKQTEAVLAYAQAHGKNAEMVAKQFATEKGRAKIMAEAELNVAKATQAASTPAANMERIQHTLMETVGKLAMTVLNALGPAIQAVVPVIEILGTLLGDTLKPLIEQLSPVVTMIANGFKDLAPVVVQLVTGALNLLMPILTPILDVLKFLIPVIVDVAKQVGTALKPVFAALIPIVQEVAGIFANGLTDVLKIALIPILQILLPILTQLLVPVLLSLMPIIKAVADIVAGVLTPVMKILTTVINAIVEKAIKPLITWITGALTSALTTVTGVISKVTGAISSIVNGVGSLLGLTSDKAVAATKETGEKVNDEAKKAADVANAQKMQQQFREKKEHEKHLMDMLKIGKLSAAEENEVRELATEEGNEGLLAKLEQYDKKKAAQRDAAARKGAAAAKKDAKSMADAAKAEADEELTIQKEGIAAKDMNARDAKIAETKAEIAHAEQLQAIAIKFYGEKSKQYQHAHTQLVALQKAEKKEEHADVIADRQQDVQDALAALEQKGIREGLSEKQIADARFAIERDALASEIELRKSYGENVSKLDTQLATMDLKHADELAKQTLAINKELGKQKLEDRKAEIDAMKASGASEFAIQQAQQKLLVDAEEERYKEELAARKDDLANKAMGHALAESLEANHQGKMKAITAQSQAQQLAATKGFLMDGLKFAQGTWKERGDAVKAYLMQELQNILLTETSKKLITAAGQAQQTALVVAGFLARQATYVAEGVASAASAAGTWIATAAKAVYNAFETLPFPVDIIAAAASVAGVAALASQVPKMFKGHAAGTDSSPGGMHWVGENGPELMNVPRGAQVIPNHHLPNLGQPPVDLTPMLHELRSIQRGISKSNETFAQRPAPVLALNSVFESSRNQFLKSEDRRSV